MKKDVPPSKDPLEGVIVAAITPRRQNELSIDLGAMLELVDFLGQSGASAIALLGSTGEFVHFPVDDRRHMTNFAAKRSRLPLLVNVSHSTLDGAVELASEAVDAGAAGLLLMPPYYFRYSQEAIRKFYLDFKALAPRDARVYLYNIPFFTSEIAIGTALSLLGTGLFAGIKDSSGSWEYFTQLRDHVTNNSYSILIGQERLYARARAEGAHGIVSGVACAVPELILALEAAVAAGDADRVKKLDARVGEFVDWISKFPAPVAIKEATRQRRIKSGAPAIDLGETEKAQMEQFLAWFGPWLGAVREECVVETGRHRGR